MHYLIIVISLLSIFTHASEVKSTCTPKLDAFIGNYEIYREQSLNNHYSTCMPTNQSKIQLKGKPDSSVEINGFVVGIERLWHKELNQIIKVTSKAGGHTTIVRLLATQRGADQFTADFDATFSSSMAYIVVSKSADGNLIVTTRDNHRGDNCQWITEDVFQMDGIVFNKTSTIEILRKCL